MKSGIVYSLHFHGNPIDEHLIKVLAAYSLLKYSNNVHNKHIQRAFLCKRFIIHAELLKNPKEASIAIFLLQKLIQKDRCYDITNHNFGVQIERRKFP
jgi:hypothetical protein